MSRTVIATPTISAQVSAGGWHTCALKTDGSLVCWGNNVEGETSIPAGLAPTVQMGTGFFSTCAASTAGTLACWGDNYYGESTPPSVTGAVQVEAGQYHACARISDGTVRCWGRDTEGETDVPPTLSGVTQISTGGLHSCALTGGSIVCWGDNTFHETTTPVTLSGATQFSTGPFHTCAIAGSAVTCWGDNSSGESAVPAGLGAVTQVSAGLGPHTCALISGGTVACWGDNTYGQAAPPAGLTGVTQISSGQYHSCALKSDGSVVCWGLNTNGQVAIPAGLDLNVVLPQTIGFNSVAPSPATAGTSYAVAAAATSGLTVTLKSLTPAVCSVAGSSVNFLTAGTCTIAADQAGDASHLPAPETTQSITVSPPLQLSQTITFRNPPPAAANVGDHLSINATGGASGNPVVLSSFTTANCTVRGNTVNFIHIGACTIAENQAGNTSYSAAPTKTATIGVIWAFRGFLGDVHNPPGVNTVNSGAAVPVKFELGGNVGSNIYASGSPYSAAASCTDWSVTGPPVAAKLANGHDDNNGNAGNGSQADDGENGDNGENGGNIVYNYLWKTDDSWAKTCRIFTVVLLDGTSHSARVQFKK